MMTVDIGQDMYVCMNGEMLVAMDKKGMIRKKHTGPLYEKIWLAEFKPLLKQLEAE